MVTLRVFQLNLAASQAYTAPWPLLRNIATHTTHQAAMNRRAASSRAASSARVQAMELSAPH